LLALALTAAVLAGALSNTHAALIQPDGGRVDWYRGPAAHELIAYDAVVDEATQDTEIFTMRPDGSQIAPVTGGNTVVPRGFVGQPAWHPDGEHIVFQAENAHSQHRRFNHMSWGINNDLWLIRRDGTGAERIWVSPPEHAALHPHFSEDGKRLVFAERIATGKVRYPRWATPGGENPWAGWQIHLAEVDLNAHGTDILSNHRVLFGAGPARDRGFYETHGFRHGLLMYSHTPGGLAYVDDCYTCALDGSEVVDRVNSPKTWDEHGVYSPGGAWYSFISSRVDPAWQAPASTAATLRTELYLQQGDAIWQATAFNAGAKPGRRYLVSDYDWDRSGTRIALQVAAVDGVRRLPHHPQIWVLTLPTAPPAAPTPGP